MEGGVFKGLHLRLWRAKNVLLYVAVWAQTGLVGGGGAGGGWVGLMVCLYLHLMGRVTWTLHVSTPGSMFVSTHTQRPVWGEGVIFLNIFSGRICETGGGFGQPDPRRSGQSLQAMKGFIPSRL